jgi:hypothetical protein
LLEFSAAYKVQEKAFGGLSAASKRKLRKRAFPKNRKLGSGVQEERSDRLSPGTRLVREWHGDIHTVDVDESGFRYSGRTYRSLSMVAREITGARWSGPRFFGL